MIAMEIGSTNLYDGTKRAREWTVFAVGTKHAVLRRAVVFAGACEVGGVVIRSKHSTPEQFIGKVRRLLGKALSASHTPPGYWRPTISHVQEGDLNLIKHLGGNVRGRSEYGTAVLLADFNNSLQGYFSFIAKRYHGLNPWYVARVYGLPRS